MPAVSPPIPLEKTMPLFSSLYPLAQKTTLTLLITVQDDKLRVNVTPRANDDAKGEKTLYPLSLLATPEELDREFAQAVQIYEPSVASVLVQAHAAAAANTATKSSSTAPALPAPTRGKPGPKPKAKPAAGTETATESSDKPDAAAETPPADGQPAAQEADPRQMHLPVSSDAEKHADEAPAVDSSAASTGATDGSGLDLF